MYLTKTRFLIGVQCPLRLWYHVHRKDLVPPISKSNRYRMDAGQKVGRLARDLFPGGHEIDMTGISLSEAAGSTCLISCS